MIYTTVISNDILFKSQGVLEVFSVFLQNCHRFFVHIFNGLHTNWTLLTKVTYFYTGLVYLVLRYILFRRNVSNISKFTKIITLVIVNGKIHCRNHIFLLLCNNLTVLIIHLDQRDKYRQIISNPMFINIMLAIIITAL